GVSGEHDEVRLVDDAVPDAVTVAETRDLHPHSLSSRSLPLSPAETPGCRRHPGILTSTARGVGGRTGCRRSTGRSDPECEQASAEDVGSPDMLVAPACEAPARHASNVVLTTLLFKDRLVRGSGVPQVRVRVLLLAVEFAEDACTRECEV